MVLLGVLVLLPTLANNGDGIVTDNANIAFRNAKAADLVCVKLPLCRGVATEYIA